MSGVLSLLVGGGGRSVNIAGGVISDIQLTPADAYAAYILNPSGLESSDPSGLSNTWLLSGAASAYEVRATLNSGSVSSGTTGSWLSMGSL